MLLLFSPGDFQPSEVPSGRWRVDQTGGERRVRTSGSGPNVRPEYAKGCTVNVRMSRRLAAVRGPRRTAADVREKRSGYRVVRLHGLGVQAGSQE